MIAAAPAAYHPIAKFLHWAIAVLLAVMVFLGEDWAKSWNSPGLNPQFWLHATIGIGILVLSLIRLFLRVLLPAPAYPATMPAYERIGATVTKFAFYVFMFGLPLTGWLQASGNPKYQAAGVKLLAGIPLPLFPQGTVSFMHDALQTVHDLGSKVIIPFMALHVLAALKHHFWDKDTVLTRMLPFGGSRQ